MLRGTPVYITSGTTFGSPKALVCTDQHRVPSSTSRKISIATYRGDGVIDRTSVSEPYCSRR